MNQDLKLLWIILAIIAVIMLFAIFFMVNRSLVQTPAPQPNQTTTPTPNTSQEPNTTTTSVEIKNFSFEPVNKEINKSTTVIWTNNDSAIHTVTSDDGFFSSPQLQTGEKFQFTFNDSGSFSYHCTLHADMKAKIVVK